MNPEFPTTTFKAGDRIKVTGAGTHSGKFGTVTRDYDSNHSLMIYTQLDDGSTATWSLPDSVELIEEKADPRGYEPNTVLIDTGSKDSEQKMYFLISSIDHKGLNGFYVHDTESALDFAPSTLGFIAADTFYELYNGEDGP